MKIQEYTGRDLDVISKISGVQFQVLWNQKIKFTSHIC